MAACLLFLIALFPALGFFDVYPMRFSYVADPEYVDVPWKGLLSDSYTERRGAHIQRDMPGTIAAGDPWVEEGRSPTKALEASRLVKVVYPD